jgi:hypothetical protein
VVKGNVEITREMLEQYVSIIGDWIPKEAAIAIAVGGRYIYYLEGIQDIRLIEGQPVAPGSIADKVITKRLKVDKIMDNTLFGSPYYGIGYPIDLQGEPGALLVILPSNYHVLKHEPFRFLTGKQEDEWCPVPVEEIAYIESLQKKTWFYVDSEQYWTSHTLKDLQVRLPETFLRIHRSYIVNILAIERISRDITSNLLLRLRDGTELTVSQTYMTEVKKVLGF